MIPQRIKLGLATLAEQLESACLLEVAARKVGNVHAHESFEDLNFDDFKIAAKVTGETLSRVEELGVGRATLETILRTRHETGSNVNLGITLLLAPLAAVPEQFPLSDGIELVVSDIDLAETKIIYEAIRTARAGGLGKENVQDIAEEPTQPIRECMALVQHRDAIARQYCQKFSDVLDFGRQTFLRWWETMGHWESTIIATQLEFLHWIPDSLIERKCDRDVAVEAGRRAKLVLDKGWPKSESGIEELLKLDRWLRADGHKRNPGTTADLIAAVLFSVIRDRQWTPPEEIQV